MATIKHAELIMQYENYPELSGINSSTVIKYGFRLSGRVGSKKRAPTHRETRYSYNSLNYYLVRLRIGAAGQDQRRWGET